MKPFGSETAYQSHRHLLAGSYLEEYGSHGISSNKNDTIDFIYQRYERPQTKNKSSMKLGKNVKNRLKITVKS